MSFSEEQLKIINSTESEVSVASPPGSGKTFTILGVVKHNKKKHHLILAFNSAIKASIQKKIDEESITNAEVFTFHSLAYDFFKGTNQIVSFENRNLINFDYFSLEQILKSLNLKVKKIYNILTTINEFFSSEKTVSEFFGDIEEKTAFVCKSVLKYIMSNKDAPMFHEYYIKMFQLIKYSNSKYDTVLVDESQDKTACYDLIIKNLKTKRVIHFGDNQQKIYAYNGAIGMENSEYKLTKSFRIGKEHSDVCNALISDILKDESTSFEGVNKNGVLVDKLSNVDKKTIICRTNKEIIRRMLKEVENKKIVHLIGGGGLNLELISSVYTSSSEKPFYFRGKRIDSLKDAIDLYVLSKSRDLKQALDFINEYKSDTLKVINIIKNKTIDDDALADVSLITAHRSKGLEFSCVEIADDFPTVLKIKEKRDLGETYALYVALSRSTGKMLLNKDLTIWYDKFKKNKIKEPVIECGQVSELF